VIPGELLASKVRILDSATFSVVQRRRQVALSCFSAVVVWPFPREANASTAWRISLFLLLFSTSPRSVPSMASRSVVTALLCWFKMARVQRFLRNSLLAKPSWLNIGKGLYAWDRCPEPSAISRAIDCAQEHLPNKSYWSTAQVDTDLWNDFFHNGYTHFCSCFPLAFLALVFPRRGENPG
jgi:hypothetical protein